MYSDINVDIKQNYAGFENVIQEGFGDWRFKFSAAYIRLCEFVQGVQSL